MRPRSKLLDTLSGTVFTAGDNAYQEGTASQFANCYGPTWGRHKLRTRPSPGNHDYATNGASAYYAYFGSRAGPAGRGYYSYEVGSWHVVSLNSNVSMANGSAQHSWLKNDLAASDALCTLAYWHHPLFASGTQVGGSTASKPLWNLLFAAGADVILGRPRAQLRAVRPTAPRRSSQCDPRHTGVHGGDRWEESLRWGGLTTAAQQPDLQWDDMGACWSCGLRRVAIAGRSCPWAARPSPMLAAQRVTVSPARKHSRVVDRTGAQFL